MTGSVSHITLDQLKQRATGEQSTIHRFGGIDKTYVGVARLPKDMGQYCDEVHPELGPPSALFAEFLEERRRLVSDGYSYQVAHNRAFHAMGYDSRYRRYLLDEGDHPEECSRPVFEEMLNRVRDGEHLVFVCHCRKSRECHRTVLVDELTEWRKQARQMDTDSYCSLASLEEGKETVISTNQQSLGDVGE